MKVFRNKKGFLLAEETLKIILAVISIGVLVYLLTALYNPSQKSQELQFAEASLEHLISEIDEGSQNVMIYNPEGWWILSEEARGELCICSGKTYRECAEEEGVCKDSDFEASTEIELEDLPLRLEINYEDRLISKS